SAFAVWISWLPMAKKRIVNLIVFKEWNFWAGCLLIVAASAICGSSRSPVVGQKPSQRSILYASRIGQFAHAALAVALAGCTLGPDFVPAPQLPAASYTGEPIDPWLQQPPDPSWWAVFRDPILTDLERRVAAENLDVLTATVRLAESRFQR